MVLRELETAYESASSPLYPLSPAKTVEVVAVVAAKHSSPRPTPAVLLGGGVQRRPYAHLPDRQCAVRGARGA